MKKKLYSIFTIILILGSFYTSSARNQHTSTKIAYANLEYIMNQLPEAKKIEKEIKSLEKNLKSKLEQKIKLFQEKIKEFQKEYDKMKEEVKKNKQQELQELQKEIETLEKKSQSSIAKKQVDLVKPLYEKINKTIQDLAKAHNYNIVLSENIGGMPIVLHSDKNINLSDLVLKKLGVTPKK